MTLLEKGKIARFLEDTVLANAVYGVIQNEFLKITPNTTDVNFLAAERISMICLRQAWDELEKCIRESGDKEVEIQRNVGL